MLAQDLASLDVLSDGRLDIGIGAGWNKPEYEQTGIAFDPVPARVARMEESITVLKGLFAEGPFTFHGTYYSITDMDGMPKPVQRPHPPFLIGGGGRRTLSIAGREAQIVGLAPRIGRDCPGRHREHPGAGHRREDRVGAEAAGERFDEPRAQHVPVRLAGHRHR